MYQSQPSSGSLWSMTAYDLKTAMGADAGLNGTPAKDYCILGTHMPSIEFPDRRVLQSQARRWHFCSHGSPSVLPCPAACLWATMQAGCWGCSLCCSEPAGTVVAVSCGWRAECEQWNSPLYCDRDHVQDLPSGALEPWTSIQVSSPGSLPSLAPVQWV